MEVAQVINPNAQATVTYFLQQENITNLWKDKSWMQLHLILQYLCKYKSWCDG